MSKREELEKKTSTKEDGVVELKSGRDHVTLIVRLEDIMKCDRAAYASHLRYFYTGEIKSQ